MPDAEIAPDAPSQVDGSRTPPAREAWVVLGMHRSGTSAMARVLELSGGRMPVDLLPATEANALGYFESAAVLALNDDILAAADSAWDDPFSGRPRPYLSQFDQGLRRRAAEVVAAAFGGGHDPIVLKDPRINVLAAFWDATLKAESLRPYYVIMVRHPAEVAASLLTRDQMPVELGLLLWLDHMLAAERDTRGAPRVFVSYDDLLRDWRGVLDRVEAAWAHPLPRRTGVAAAEIARALQPGLRHQKAEQGGLPLCGVAAVMSAEAYDWFRASAAGQTPHDRAPLEKAVHWLDTLHGQLEPVVTYQKLHLAKTRSELQRYMAHARALEEVREVLDAELGRVRAALDVRVAELQQAREALDGCSAELSRSQDGFAAQLRELQASTAERDAATEEALRTREAALASQLSEVERLQARCQEFLAQLAADRSGLSTQLEAERRERQALEAAHQEAVRELEAKLEREGAERDILPASFEEELEDLDGRYRSLSDEMRRVQAVADTALVRRRKLEAELKEAMRAADELRILVGQAVSTRSALEIAREALAREVDQRQQVEARANGLVDEVEALRLDCAAAEREIDALRNERATILASRTWRVASAPRRMINGLRRG